MFEIGITQKIIINLGTIQHLFINHNLICNYYNNYLKYQTGSKKVLLFYENNTFFLSFNNGFLKLTYVWYALDLGFYFINIIYLGEKEVER